MHLSTDKQTLDDLGVNGTNGTNGVAEIFNRCATRGGSEILGDMFRNPLSDAEAIRQRLSIIRSFSAEGTTFPFTPGNFGLIEQFLDNKDERIQVNASTGMLRKIEQLTGKDVQADIIAKGVYATLRFIAECNAFCSAQAPEMSHPWYGEHAAMQLLLIGFSSIETKGKLSDHELAHFDNLFRFRERGRLRSLLRHAFLLDVYVSVGMVARQLKYAFPTVVQEKEAVLLQLVDFYHPLLPNAVPNSLDVTRDNNVIFLTGANMAGKSTFMKTVGIVLLLAHIGFPVPAAAMAFTPLDGIYTTINIPDNMGIGASHFYSEVLRVKKVVRELAAGKRLLVVFDELFRGTNVKDAYEGTVAIAGGFTRTRKSIFIISTHILEAATTLQEQCRGIRYLYMPTEMHGVKPVYSYRIQEGVSADRHGMLIIRNEGIIEMLNKGLNKKNQHELHHG